MRIAALALCATAFATILALGAPRVAATTVAPSFDPHDAIPLNYVPRSEPQASGEIHQARARTSNASPDPIVPRSEPQASGEVQWLGRYCTSAGCPDAPSSATQAASFGAAAATILFLARRRRA